MANEQTRVRFLQAVPDCEGTTRSEGSTAWLEASTAEELIESGAAIAYNADIPARDNPRYQPGTEQEETAPTEGGRKKAGRKKRKKGSRKKGA